MPFSFFINQRNSLKYFQYKKSRISDCENTYGKDCYYLKALILQVKTSVNFEFPLNIRFYFYLFKLKKKYLSFFIEKVIGISINMDN